MIRHRISAAAPFAAVVPLLLAGLTASITLTAGPAYAHGAPTDPVSRVAACGPEGEQRARSAACRAAVGANGGRPIGAWDNLRIADVNGRDRQVVPDGQLCSGGLDAYKGLDLARTDWPATTLRAGAAFTLTYASTIPHEGTFSLYLTREGYDPGKALTWDDLDPQPFITAKDPRLENGAYRITGALPDGRTGRHVLYTVWRNSSTPDTYYSCSDIDFTGSDTADQDRTPQNSEPPSASPPDDADRASAPAPEAPAPEPSAPETSAPGAAAPVPSAAESSPATSAPQSVPVPAGSQSEPADYMPMAAAGGAVMASGIVVLVARRRRAR
ncbi:lytic polysaccharide monooxygenase [Streptomyces sp. NPDC088116]|uniref:lytic polysaccharide monooxygenase auxiliary activity family 9 protein n=1 Tax=Streptomyces sp. NPDC088116 TaxID=3365825 RepID=UPI003806EA14